MTNIDANILGQLFNRNFHSRSPRIRRTFSSQRVADGALVVLLRLATFLASCPVERSVKLYQILSSWKHSVFAIFMKMLFKCEKVKIEKVKKLFIFDTSIFDVRKHVYNRNIERSSKNLMGH